MTNPQPPPPWGVQPHEVPQYGGPQYGGQQLYDPRHYGAQQYGGPPAIYRTPSRPPLTPGEKKSAFWAGAVGFNLLTLGFTIFIVPIVVGLFAGFLNWMVNLRSQSANEIKSEFDDLPGLLESIDYVTLIIIGVSVAIVGLAIMAAALFLSKAILRSAGIERAWPVTWSASGISVFVFWIFGQIPFLIAQFAILPMMIATNDVPVALMWAGIVTFVLSLALNTVIGWLAWWWMTFAFRPATRDETPTAVVL